MDLSIPLQIALYTVIGAVLGSFFNVVVYRVPRDLSIISPGSRCPSCETPVKLYDNIPVISWLLLRGKCRKCGTSISAEYPLVEASCGAVGLVLGILWHYTSLLQNTELPALYLLVVWSIPLTLTDLRHYLLPDVLTLSGIVFGLLLSLLPGGIQITESAIGAISCGVFLWGFGWLVGKATGKEALGFGDVKLVAMMGSLMGFEKAFAGIMVGSILGIIGALVMGQGQPNKGQKEIPFGPYLCLGGIVAYLFGISPFQVWKSQNPSV